jgi:hypothetical protein
MVVLRAVAGLSSFPNQSGSALIKAFLSDRRMAYAGRFTLWHFPVSMSSADDPTLGSLPSSLRPMPRPLSGADHSGVPRTRDQTSMFLRLNDDVPSATPDYVRLSIQSSKPVNSGRGR